MSSTTRITAAVLRAAVFVLFASLFAAPAGAQRDLVGEDELSDQLKVVEVTFDRSTVAGRLINRTPNTLRDIRLEVRLTWYWNNETSPGEESPGRTGFYRVPGEIGPDGDMRFVYRLEPPLPDRSDGKFRVFVSVTGFTEVGGEPAE